MMIVIPMLIQTLTFGSVYKYFLASNPSNAIIMTGFLFLLASVSVVLIKVKKQHIPDPAEVTIK